MALTIPTSQNAEVDATRVDFTALSRGLNDGVFQGGSGAITASSADYVRMGAQNELSRLVHSSLHDAMKRWGEKYPEPFKALRADKAFFEQLIADTELLAGATTAPQEPGTSRLVGSNRSSQRGGR